MAALPQPDISASAVLAKAVLKAAEQLGLTQVELGAILGLHRSGISRLKHHPHLEPHSKQGEIALLFVRMARALSALTGGDTLWMQHFIRSPNSLTGGIPAEQLQSLTGLVQLVHTLDALRAKV